MLMLSKQKIGADSDSWSPIYFCLCLLHLNFPPSISYKEYKNSRELFFNSAMVGACSPYFNNVQLTTENLPQTG